MTDNAKLTVQLPKKLLNGARRAVNIQGGTLTHFVQMAIDRLVRHAADAQCQSVEEFCKRAVHLKAGRPKKEKP